MNNYFKTTVKKLTYEDVQIIGKLYELQADSTLSAIRRQQIADELDLSKHKLSLSIYRLIGMSLIEFANGTQNTHLYVTDFGMKVIEDTLQREEI
ncbi:hypothetical protein BEH_07330 [Priestia filamentosa]|uniref:MarR family transcriptional regulator n=1 Tax=Priestia filamentosa TaxID=1402861 RepID=A0A0H4KUF2_9BACI|nr:hypothetical protein BEH_07330 [Priestia filamentosa]